MSGNSGGYQRFLRRVFWQNAMVLRWHLSTPPPTAPINSTSSGTYRQNLRSTYRQHHRTVLINSTSDHYSHMLEQFDETICFFKLIEYVGPHIWRRAKPTSSSNTGEYTKFLHALRSYGTR